MKKNLSQNSVFILSNDFPMPVFVNQTTLSLYCYSMELITKYETRIILMKAIRDIQLEMDSSCLYLVGRNFGGICLEKNINIMSIKDTENYFFDGLTTEEYNDVFSCYQSIYLQDDSCKWGCIIDFSLEWIIWGNTNDFPEVCKNILTTNFELEKLRFSNIHSAIAHNFPTGTSSKNFKETLVKNYNFIEVH
jgi:hypothetical protein